MTGANANPVNRVPPDTDEDERPVKTPGWIESQIGVATEEDRRRDRSLPAPPTKTPLEGPESARKSGGYAGEPDLPREEWGATTGLPKARLRPPPRESEE